MAGNISKCVRRRDSHRTAQHSLVLSVSEVVTNHIGMTKPLLMVESSWGHPSLSILLPAIASVVIAEACVEYPQAQGRRDQIKEEDDIIQTPLPIPAQTILGVGEDKYKSNDKCHPT